MFHLKKSLTYWINLFVDQLIISWAAEFQKSVLAAMEAKPSIAGPCIVSELLLVLYISKQISLKKSFTTYYKLNYSGI